MKALENVELKQVKGGLAFTPKYRGLSTRGLSGRGVTPDITPYINNWIAAF